jgi:hypothetical protein
MKLDYQRLGRYILAANLLMTGLVLYIGWDVMSTEAASGDDRALFAPIKPVVKIEPEHKSIFHDYSVITADRFLPQPGARPGEPAPLLPVPGPSSALDRLIKLRGTAVSSEKGLSFAIVELLQNGEFRTVRVGEEVVGATIVDIGEASVLVSMENEEVTLFFNATEEYGAGTRKTSNKRGKKNPKSFDGSTAQMPPGMQEFLKRLPPDRQKEAMKKWQNASPEDRKKAIKRFMDNAGGQGQGRGGNKRMQRDSRNRR